MTEKRFQFAIDRGGTFTDLWARSPSGKVFIHKMLSEDPENYLDAPSEGIRRILKQNDPKELSTDNLIDGTDIDWIRMGTTVATNALLEKKGEQMAVLVTKGFKDLFLIGDQSRKELFVLKIDEPYILYDDIIEVDERIALKHSSCQISGEFVEVECITGDKVIIWKNLNIEDVKASLKNILLKGIRNLAVVLLHSYLYDKHEKVIEELAYKMGFDNVVLSSKSSSMVKALARGSNASLDAYLTPVLRKYITSFLSGFQYLSRDQVLFMQSNGNMTSLDNFTGSKAIMSGPAGGVVGYALTAFNKMGRAPLIGFDMGGTSTDVSRFSGIFEETVESCIGGVKLLTPHLDLQTVAAGGGSKLHFHCGIFYVGPESAGANPGPACYRKGGPLTITDANLILRRLLPDYFPKVFGENRDQPLDFDISYKAFEKLTKEINSFAIDHGGKVLTVEEVALGFINVANEAMSRPIRALTEAKGYDTSQHVLCCFGGAGGQHACSIAKSLGIQRVFIHKYSGILSAFGIALADFSTEKQEPCSHVFSTENFEALDLRITKMKHQCLDELRLKNFQADSIETEVFLHMKYEGTDFDLICSNGRERDFNKELNLLKFESVFINKFRQEFGFNLEKDIIVECLRVRGYGKSCIDFDVPAQNCNRTTDPKFVAKVYFDGEFLETPVFEYDSVALNHILHGPAIVINENSTIVVEPECDASFTSSGDMEIRIKPKLKHLLDLGLHAPQLSIFSHRFMSIAEQMGRVLQRTALSVNIKERLDFSCALFGPDGGLVANAPHIPVHLGAMQKAVQFQVKNILNEGDVILSNHPCVGGSHLPDLTVITPVFHSDLPKPIFYVACRGHHADIGGTTPGSMPSNSKSIFEEGAIFKSFFLVKGGKFNESELIKALEEPSKYPNSSGSRNIKDNICDLQAQIAANKKGILLVKDLIEEYGLDVVLAYMQHIQSIAEQAVCHTLKEIACTKGFKNNEVSLVAEESMDEGYKIKLSITINKEGSATFDFSGSSYEMYGNLNTPEAVTYSAIIYCLRCMVKEDIPLNQGCLKPINLIIPQGSILSPSENAAVVGGNVLTSQRIVDVIFKVFEICAASQGCMNNVTFGDETVGYYETVGGGSGAGPFWHGRSGVHTHMTNTRITDAEVLEKRYPVLITEFSLNIGSGGKGKFNGGDGIIRELLFRKPLLLCVLSERRVLAPYGMNGGSPGKCGANYLIRDGRVINLGAKCTILTKAGDIFRLMTPGGGGYGSVED